MKGTLPSHSDPLPSGIESTLDTAKSGSPCESPAVQDFSEGYKLLSACVGALKERQREYNRHARFYELWPRLFVPTMTPAHDICIEDIEFYPEGGGGLVSRKDWMESKGQCWPYGRGLSGLVYFMSAHQMLNDGEPYTLFDERESQLLVLIWMCITHLHFPFDLYMRHIRASFRRRDDSSLKWSERSKKIGSEKLRLLTDWAAQKPTFGSTALDNILEQCISIAATCYRMSPCPAEVQKHNNSVHAEYYRFTSSDFFPAIMKIYTEEALDETKLGSWKEDDKISAVDAAKWWWIIRY